jgi:hypothetical protein
MKKDDKLMNTMPKYEWEMAWNYHQALMTSISAALLASGLVEDDTDELVQNENERVIDSDSDDEDDDNDEEDESEEDGEVFEFVELDVGEAAMPTAEFTAELMDSSDDDSEDSDEDDDSSDDYEVVEIVPPLENERDEL